MAKVHDELLDHDYDGIREYDNPLPAWWQWMFYGTILFSLLYIPYYIFGYGLSQGEMYQTEIAAAEADYPAWAQAKAAVGMAPAAQGGQADSGAAPAPGLPVPDLMGNAQAIAAGGELYVTNCAACHGPEGQGGIGPNLTDNYWLHGNSWENVVRTINNGVPDKGMIAWKALFNPTKIAQSAAFVMTLQGTNPPNPKEPQGTEMPAN